MKEWKLRQEIYHRLHRDHADQHDDRNAEIMQDQSHAAVVAQVVRYFSVVPPLVIYPAKSYFVALVYARLLRDHFAEDALSVLDDPDLLFGNDPHFVPYGEHQSIYDDVLAQVGWQFDLTQGETPDVRNYFNQEFMITPDQ